MRTLVTRQRDHTTAVGGVSFSIDEGEIVGYLGPNGAGKSTTIKMLTGILLPTSDTVRVAGLVPWEERERNALNIGVVFGQRNTLWWNLPLDESFRLVAKMYRVPEDKARRTISMLVELLEMESFLGGSTRRLARDACAGRSGLAECRLADFRVAAGDDVFEHGEIDRFQVLDVEATDAGGVWPSLSSWSWCASMPSAR